VIGKIVVPFQCFDCYTVIGNIVIHAGTILGADAFYYKKKRPEGYDLVTFWWRVVSSKDNVGWGALCTISKGVTGDTTIG
jgi:UDP-3-O-[3-hydroxymyristoyl] glucosamine N-acyltransferase